VVRQLKWMIGINVVLNVIIFGLTFYVY
jgi:hypothetical protein